MRKKRFSSYLKVILSTIFLANGATIEPATIATGKLNFQAERNLSI